MKNTINQDGNEQHMVTLHVLIDSRYVMIVNNIQEEMQNDEIG